MLCQSCNYNEANMHFSTNINGQVEERHLCEECANLESELGMVEPISLGYILGGLISEVDLKIDKVDDNICPKCGISYDRFLQTGRFGCSNCYDTFDRDVSTLLKNIHGHDEHLGKVPSKSSKRIKIRRKIDEVESLMKKAIEKEEFEMAAEYRDEIKMLKDSKIDDIQKEI